MSATSKYKSIATRHEAIFRDRGSKFIAIALPFTDSDSLKELLTDLRKEHPKANHLCYAYTYDWEQVKQRANDDGEPNGSAGLPILGQIKSHNVLDILLVVVRYFGGTKLGVSGLKNAYKTSAAMVLDDLPIFYKTMSHCYRIRFPYDKTNQIDALCLQWDILITHKLFNDQVEMIIEIPIHAEKECIKLLQPYLL